ncbi:MAG: entericidin A/B family lipoprotein [Chthoniobacteraceae bacterium]
MRTKTRFALLFLAAALLTLATTGCNTIHGAGRDIEQTGEHIERASR